MSNRFINPRYFIPQSRDDHSPSRKATRLLLAGAGLWLAIASIPCLAITPSKPVPVPLKRVFTPSRPAASNQRPPGTKADAARRHYVYKRTSSPLGMAPIPGNAYDAALEAARDLPQYSTPTGEALPSQRQMGHEPDAAFLWTELGPDNIAGRTRSLAVHPTLVNGQALLYVGGVGGGVWASSNEGQSWQPTDQGSSSPLGRGVVGAMALIPGNSPGIGGNDILIAGMGEGFFVTDDIRGDKVYRSINGGRDWTDISSEFLPVEQRRYINDIVVSTDKLTVFVATSNGDASPQGGRVFRSTNAGVSFQTAAILSTESLPGEAPGTPHPGGVTDLALVTVSGVEYLVASVGTFSPNALAAGYTFQRTRVVRSTVSAQSVTAGQWAIIDIPSVGPGSWNIPNTELGRVTFGVSGNLAPVGQPASNIIYALASRWTQGIGDSGLYGVFRLDPPSWTWQAKMFPAWNWLTGPCRPPSPSPTPTPDTRCGKCTSETVDCFLLGQNCSQIKRGQGWYDSVIAVDPKNESRIFVGGPRLFRSDNAGAPNSWRLIAAENVGAGSSKYAHEDQHVIAFHPAYDGSSNKVLFAGNDGGVFRMSDALATHAINSCAVWVDGGWSSRVSGLRTTQFYHGSADHAGAVARAGTQDNRALETAGAGQWSAIPGLPGDCGYVAISSPFAGESPIVVVASPLIDTQTASKPIAVYVDGVERGSYLVSNDDFLFVAPIALQDIQDQGGQRKRRLWVGGHKLWRNDDPTNPSPTWVQDLGVILPAPSGSEESEKISAIEVLGDFVVLGTTHGRIFRYSPATGWSSTREPSLVNDSDRLYCSDVSFQAGFSASDPAHNKIYVTFSTFDSSKQLYRVGWSGSDWTALGTGTNPLPWVPANSVLPDPFWDQRLFVGTDIGVFVSTNGGATWHKDASVFGNAPVEWLAVNAGTPKKLYAFTHGRGAYSVELCLPVESDPPGITLTGSVCGGYATEDDVTARASGLFAFDFERDRRSIAGLRSAAEAGCFGTPGFLRVVGEGPLVGTTTLGGGRGVSVEQVEVVWPDGIGETTITVWPLGNLDLDTDCDVVDAQLLAGYIVQNLMPGVPPYLGNRAQANAQDDDLVDIFDLVVLQNFIVGNVPCLPQTPQQGQSMAAAISGRARVSTTSRTSSVDFEVDLSPASLSGKPVRLGAYLLRVDFDPQAVEYLGAAPAAPRAGRERLTTEIVATVPGLANERGNALILVSDALGNGAGGGVDLGSCLFREKRTRGMSTVRASVVQLATTFAPDSAGRRQVHPIPFE